MKTRIENEVELPLISPKSTQEQLEEAITLLTKMKKNVKTDSPTEAQLIEIEKFSKTLLEKVENNPKAHEEVQECIKLMMKQFSRLANALLDHPTKFAAMNKGQLVLKTFTDIKGVLETINDTLNSLEEKESGLYEVRLKP